MDAAVTVALVSAAGVIGASIIQAWNTASANRRADRVRADERADAEKRRNEDREDAARQRAEEREAEHENRRAEQAAAELAADLERIAQQRAARRRAASAFIAQAEKCYGLMQLASSLGNSVDTAVPMADWTELGRLLGDVVLHFDSPQSDQARDFVRRLQGATRADTYQPAMNAASEALQAFVAQARESL